MKNFLESQMGKEIDVTCEGATISGRVTRIEGNILSLEKEGVICHINIDKIVVVWEPRDRKVQTPGFTARPSDR
ncbi:MAG: MM0924 family protein [Blastocatellia bacterium]